MVRPYLQVIKGKWINRIAEQISKKYKKYIDFTCKDINGLNMKSQKKTFLANNNQKKAGVAKLIHVGKAV